MTHVALVVWALVLLLGLNAAPASALKRTTGQGQTRQLLASPAPIAIPDYNIYHRKDVLLNKVAQIVQANPSIMSIETRSAGDNGYNISMKVVDIKTAGLASPDTGKARILVDFGEHAREFVSSELGLSFIDLLANPAAIKALVGGGARGDRVVAQLGNITWKILPMENEKGRDLVEAGKLCERKNGRGVDPNRNWEVDWGKKEPDYDPEEENPGLKPFSEPESQTVLDIARTFKPHVWINVHSGMEAMFTPWDHVAQVPDAAKEALRILQTIKESVFTDSCVVGSGGKSVGYLAHGTATDYMFERLNVPIPYTWEIYGDFGASFNDCFRMFNPVTKEHLEKVITLWLKAIFRLVELLPTHPAIIQDAIFSAPQTATPAQETATPTQETAKPDTQQTATPTQQITKPDGQAATPQPGPSLEPSSASQPEPAGAKQQATEKQPTATTEKQPTGSSGEAITPKSEDTVVTVHTPFHHILRGGALWGPWIVGVAGVAILGMLLYRLASKPKLAGYRPPSDSGV